MAGPKAPKSARVQRVADMLIMGATTSEIKKYAGSANPAADPPKVPWNVSDRTVDNYIAAAKTLIESEAAEKRAYMMNLSDKRINMLFRASLQTKDYKTALAAQKEFNTLHGLYERPSLQILDVEDLSPLALLIQGAAKHAD